MKTNIYCLLVFVYTIVAIDAKANDYRIAEQAFKLGEFYKSERYFKLAIKEFKFRDQQKQLANTINRLAENLRILGYEKRAETLLLNNEHAIIDNPDLRLELAQCYDVLGELRYYVFDNVRAGYYFRKSLQIKRDILKRSDADLALSFSNMGRYYNFTQQLDSAVISTLKAYLIITNHPVNNNYINFERIYCEYAYALKEHKEKDIESWYSTKVRPVLFEALKYNHRHYSNKNYWLATVEHSLGNTYTDILNLASDKRLLIDHETKTFYFKQAVKCYALAIIIFKAIKPENNPRLSMTYFVTGLADSYFGADPRLALKNYQKAIRQFITETDTNDYLTLPTTKNAPYNIHQYLTLISYKIEAMDRLINIHNSILWQKFILNHTDHLITEWGELIKQYQIDDNKDITTYYFIPPYEVALKACVNLYNRTHQKRYLEKALYYCELSKYGAFFKQKFVNASTVTGFLASLKTTSLNITYIQKNLNTGEAVYEVYDGLSSMFTLIITKGACQIKRIPITNTDLDSFNLLSKDIDKIQFGDFKKIAYHTYLLFGLNNKILDSIKILHVLPGISYSFRVPFDALIKSLKGNIYKKLDYLLYKFQFYYSLSMLLMSKAELIKSKQLKIVYASPNSMSSLIFSKLLVDHLIKNYGAKTINVDEPVKLILQKLNNQNIIHIATHTVVNEHDPDKSYVALNNQKILITDIYKYRTESNLINLASCETTLGKSNISNGSILNFVRAFSYSGALAITSTLWKVDDEMTAKFYGIFYEQLAMHKNKPLALNNAKIKYLNDTNNDGANPYYWAGIILYGNTNAITITRL